MYIYDIFIIATTRQPKPTTTEVTRPVKDGSKLISKEKSKSRFLKKCMEIVFQAISKKHLRHSKFRIRCFHKLGVSNMLWMKTLMH